MGMHDRSNLHRKGGKFDISIGLRFQEVSYIYSRDSARMQATQAGGTRAN